MHFTQYISLRATTIVQLPLAFVRSGDINLPDGNISGSGYGGYNWSRTVNSSTVAYRLVFNTNGVNTNRDGYYYGFPLRCRFLFPPLGTTWVEAAEGKTVETMTAE